MVELPGGGRAKRVLLPPARRQRRREKHQSRWEVGRSPQCLQRAPGEGPCPGASHMCSSEGAGRPAPTLAILGCPSINCWRSSFLVGFHHWWDHAGSGTLQRDTPSASAPEQQIASCPGSHCGQGGEPRHLGSCRSLHNSCSCPPLFSSD